MSTNLKPSPWFNGLVIYIALTTVGAKWLVALNFGPLRLEMSNLGTLMLVGFLALGVLFYRQFRAPMILNIQMILLLLLMASFSIHGDFRNIAVMSIAATLGAYAVVNTTDMRNSTPVLLAFLSFFGFFIYSAVISNVNLVEGFLEYFTTGNRDRFNFRVLRPVYNAFSQSDNFQDEEFRAQLNNAVAAAYTTFYILAGSYALTGERRMIPVAILSLIMVFAIFSSSSVLTCVLVSLIFMAYYLLTAKSAVGPTLFIMLGIIFLIVAGPAIMDYMTYNLTSDTDSREGRLLQYAGSLDVIEQHMLFGVGGLARFHNHYVHNLFLFAFSSIGIIGAVCVGCILVYVISLSVQGIRLILAGAPPQPELLMVTCLPILFFIRVNVGGGGGLPTGGGLVALAIALVARRALPGQKSRWQHQNKPRGAVRGGPEFSTSLPPS